jgi:hypothetical protein
METLKPITNARPVTVLGSRSAMTAKGQAGLALKIEELGTIVFPMNLRAVEGLRTSLNEIEQYLNQSGPGKAH